MQFPKIFTFHHVAQVFKACTAQLKSIPFIMLKSEYSQKREFFEAKILTGYSFQDTDLFDLCWNKLMYWIDLIKNWDVIYFEFLTTRSCLCNDSSNLNIYGKQFMKHRIQMLIFKTTWVSKNHKLILSLLSTSYLFSRKCNFVKIRPPTLILMMMDFNWFIEDSFSVSIFNILLMDLIDDLRIIAEVYNKLK